MLFGQDGHGLFQLALAAAALADEGPDGLGEVAAEDGVQPFPHGGHAVGPAGNGGGVGVAVLVLAALHPALFFQPIQEVEHRGRGPALGSQLFADVAPGGRRAAGPDGQQHLLLGGGKGLAVLRDTVHGIASFQKNIFTIVSDTSILPESTPKRKSGKSSGHAVILYLFYRCLRICSYTTNVCALCDFNADRNAASLCKDALVLHPSKPVYYGQIQNTNAAKVRAAFP